MVLNLLQGLPLALDQAGSYMRETGTNALQYMKLYKETWRVLVTQQHDFAIQKAEATNILTTWMISFNELQEKCQEAADLLILWAFLDNQDIWYELFTPALASDLTNHYLIGFSDALATNLNLRNVQDFVGITTVV